ncbi:MGMT family protein [bacterium]|nr:MGMT family protein [bacterium]
MKPNSKANLFDKIYDIVRLIPAGKVATYGQIAAIAGHCSPRVVGYAMASLPYDDVPWHRVINSQGKVSARKDGDDTSIQQQLLEAEGVAFDMNGKVDFKAAGWVYNPKN